jgi:KilA-N domain
MNAASALLTYCGTRIRDRDEMLCLTDMWRAAGSPENREPWNWSRKEGLTFIEFTAENLNLPVSQVVIANRGGRDPATWAHWQIGMAYAKYLSPEFHAWCNQVVRSHMELTRKAPTSIEILDSLFDRKLEPLHHGMMEIRHEQTEIRGEIAEVRGNVIILAKRVDDMAPRHDFTANTRRSFVAIVWKFYFGECPCCRKTKIVLDGREIKDAAHCDHFNGRERNAPADGWLVCVGCNYRLTRDPQFKDRAKPLFQVFQIHRFEIFGNKGAQSPRKHRSSRTSKNSGQAEFNW